MSKPLYIMNRKKSRAYQLHQIMILPPALDEWLPEDHPVHFIRQVVDQLDLSAIYSDYTERRGQPPYEPRLMVKVWLYAYMRGIRSWRRLERARAEAEAKEAAREAEAAKKGRRTRRQPAAPEPRPADGPDQLHRPRVADPAQRRQGLHPGVQRPAGRGRGNARHRGR